MNNVPAVDMLLKKGAIFKHKKQRYYETPLQQIIQQDFVQVVDLLLTAKAASLAQGIIH